MEQALAELPERPAPPGVDRDIYGDLKERLAELLRQRLAGELKGVSAVPDRPPYDDFGLTRASDPGPVSLVWRYHQIGDCNQDGTVDLVDVDELAVHWYEVVSRASEPLDGNGDGVVNICDITPIAANFGSSIDHFVVERTEVIGEAFEGFLHVNILQGRLPGWRSFVAYLPNDTGGYWRITAFSKNRMAWPSVILDVATGEELGQAAWIVSAGPSHSIAGDTVSFHVHALGDEPLSFDWDFGGAGMPATSSEEEPELAVGEPGDYEVTLSVSNELGSDTYSFGFRVWAPLSEGDWSRQVPGIPSCSGEHCGFSLCPVTGEPVIVYVDSDTDEVMLARREQGEWQKKTILGAEPEVYNLQMRLDRRGNAVVAYLARVDDGEAHCHHELGLWFESPPEGQGAAPRIRLPALDVSMSLALAPDGEPTVAFTPHGENLYLAHLVQGGLHAEKLWDGWVSLGSRALNIDRWGRPMIVFAADGAAGRQTLAAMRDESHWSFEWIVKAGGVAPIALEFDRYGTPFICYMGLRHQVEVAKRGPFGYWEASAPESYAGRATQLDLAVTSGGYPVLAYVLRDVGASGVDLAVLAWEDGEGWHREVVSVGVESIQHPALRLSVNESRTALILPFGGLCYYERAQPLP